MPVARLPAIAGPQPYPMLSAHYVMGSGVTDARAFTLAGPKEVHRYEVVIGKRDIVLVVERQPPGTFGWFVSGARVASTGATVAADEAIRRLELGEPLDTGAGQHRREMDGPDRPATSAPTARGDSPPPR